MSEIRLLTLPDLPQANEIRQNAYPTMEDRSPKGQQRAVDRLALQMEQNDLDIYGLFRNEELLGVMKLYDFTMNFMGQLIPLGGLGGVAVSLLHKKKGVAREMVQFFQRHYEERGYPFTALYPFQPDFYRQMGYGFGTRRFGISSKTGRYPGGEASTAASLPLTYQRTGPIAGMLRSGISTNAWDDGAYAARLPAIS